MPGGWAYIMTNMPHGTLYIGVTSNLARRVWEHREGAIEGFTKRYRLTRLIFAEPHETIQAAIRRERTMKRWIRVWKVDLVEASNPGWEDLYRLLV